MRSPFGNRDGVEVTTAPSKAASVSSALVVSTRSSPSTGRRKTTAGECRTVVLVFELPVLLLQVLPDSMLGLAEVPLQLLDGLVRNLELSLPVGDQLVRRRTVGALLVVVRWLVAVVLLNSSH